MRFDLCIKNSNIIIDCSKTLKDFSNEFIKYYNDNIENLKRELGINQDIVVTVYLTDDEEKAGFVYGKSSFSGCFNETGCFAYINLRGKKTKEYMFKGLMHELIHHFYKFYVYGPDKIRITWVDEGLAQFFSKQKDDLWDDSSFKLFVLENLKNIENYNLNDLSHEDRSFGNNNGYNLSYIVIRFLYENNTHENFINIIKDQNKLLGYGSSILQIIKECFTDK